MTARCAIYMGALKIIFESPRDYAHGSFCRNLSWAFVLIDPMNVRTKFEVCSFTRSWWDNSDCSFRLGLRTPDLGELGEAVGVEDGTVERALVTSYRLSIVTFPLSLCISEILRVLQHATFPHPPLISPKLLNVPLAVGGWPFGYEERR